MVMKFGEIAENIVFFVVDYFISNSSLFLLIATWTIILYTTNQIQGLVDLIL